jgi:F-type H+-transporting ATPase subunit delta
MKISKESRRAARKLFRCCIVATHLDENRVRTAVSALASAKPRGYLQMLSEIERLVRTETLKNTLTIETAVQIEDNHFKDIHTRIQKSFPRPLKATKHVNPSLIGGLRIKVGSDIWDGSVAGRLQSLTRNGHH